MLTSHFHELMQFMLALSRCLLCASGSILLVAQLDTGLGLRSFHGRELEAIRVKGDLKGQSRGCKKKLQDLNRVS